MGQCEIAVLWFVVGVGTLLAMWVGSHFSCKIIRCFSKGDLELKLKPVVVTVVCLMIAMSVAFAGISYVPDIRTAKSCGESQIEVSKVSRQIAEVAILTHYNLVDKWQ